MEFFRKEVQRRRDETLTGPLVIGNQVSWITISICMVLALAAAVAIGGTATSPETITAEGVLLFGGGSTRIVAPRAGNISATPTADGDYVHVGQPIVTVAIDDVGPNGVVPGKADDDTLAAEERLARERLGSVNAKLKRDEETSQIQIDEIKLKLISDTRRAANLNVLIEKMNVSYQLANGIAARGFVSEQELIRQQEALLDRKDALAALQRDSQADRSALERLYLQQNAAREEYTLATAELAAAQMRLKQARAELSLRQGYELRATRAGTVRNLEMRVGDYVEAGATLAVITPGGRSAWVARLALDDRSAALVQEGASLSLALNAFPPAQYGYLQGKILRVQRTPNPTSKPDVPVYVALASVEISDILVRRPPIKLVDGMPVRASISMTTTSFFGRIFHPSTWFRQL